MQIAIVLEDSQVEELDRLVPSEFASRAEAVRTAVATWLVEYRAQSIDRRYERAYSECPADVDDIDSGRLESDGAPRWVGGPRMVRRGEVRWADLGGKERPVLLLTRQAVIGRLRAIVVAPCTTTIRDLPSEVPLGPSEGLPKPCVVNLDNVTLIDAGALGHLVATLDGAVMRRVCTAINAALGCDR